MRIALDLDKTVYAYPVYFSMLASAMQLAGHEVGIITAQDESQKDAVIANLKTSQIVPDFLIFKPEEMNSVSDGVFKGITCLKMDIDALYDDFETQDEGMYADFLSVNGTTIVMMCMGLINVLE